ncbi:MAG: undecaprenyl-phosphate glucose phosphotransferase [Candidatus Sumerlaeota bacterium]|nr:undecaprenyl-phosphate glucose phosphotransferase [Candidatus Sumerlaeota bacterium]
MGERRLRLKLLLLFVAADLTGVLAGLWGAYYLRFHTEIIEVTKGYDPADYIRLMPFAAFVVMFWLHSNGCYGFRERAFNLQILKKIFNSCLMAVMTVVAIHFFLRSQDYSRIVYLLSVVTCTAGLGVSRFVLDRVLARLRHAGRFASTPTLILGTGQLAGNIADRIHNHAYLGLRVAGFVSSQPMPPGAIIAGFPVLGDFKQIREIVRQNKVDEVIIAQPDLLPAEILKFIIECEKEIVSIRVVPNLLEAELVEMTVEQIDGIPLFGLKVSPLQGWNIVFKRAFDFAVSFIVLFLSLPLLAVISIAVKLTSPGPVFFRQQRVGLDGRRFHICKYRSMHKDAEELTGPIWAREADPRVTPLGRILRKFGLDELPQFYNVLLGDMSLVGPRPERPHFVQQFREQVPRYMGRHRVKSGITGWAQVNGLRGNTSIDERIKYDLFYIENWSFWLDLKILLMTLRARENAY